MKKKIVFALLLAGMFCASNNADAKRWVRTGGSTDSGNGCQEDYYVCSSGFGFSGCSIGSTRTVITCS